MASNAFTVTAVNGSGFESDPSVPVITNLTRIPSMVVEVKVQLVFE